MESEIQTARAFHPLQQQPIISVSGGATSSRPMIGYLPYRYSGGRPLSNCSIESIGSFVCSESSSWLSTDLDDDHLLHAVHRLSMSSCSSWTVSELGDDQGLESRYEGDDDDDYPDDETDQLIEDSLLTLACLNGGEEDRDSAVSCQSLSASDSVKSASNRSVTPSAIQENTKDITVGLNKLRLDRQSRFIEECDLDLIVKLDITIDDARVARAFLMQQDSTLVAMSEARILQLPFLKDSSETMSNTTSSSSKSLLSTQLCGLTSSRTLNRLGNLPDVTDVATKRTLSVRRKKVAHLNFWEQMTTNTLSDDKTKRRSMLY